MTTRYPGIRPFERNDRSVFFGRDGDIEQLGRFIRLEKFVVLNGKSGLGKSSLLNAGVIPELENLDYDLHTIRLGAYDPTRRAELNSPFETLYSRLKGEASYLGDHLPLEDTIWTQAKHRQLLGKSGKGLVLVMDQFEELFTWPPPEFEHFKSEFAALVNLQMPPQLANYLRNTPLETFTEAQWEEIYSPLNIKVVMAIRSDRLALLNQLTDELPDILGKIFELKPLDRESARSAILLPARQEGDFSSKPFGYSLTTQEAILDFLSDDYQGRVESFQLQLVCQYIEDFVVPKEAEGFEVQFNSLPPLEEIFSNYYNRQIQGIGKARDQRNVRRFIEEGLILEEEERRLSVFEGVIRRRYGIDKKLLEQLVVSRLIRAEPLIGGGYSYELSHDTLVPPILESKKARKLKSQQRRWATWGGVSIIVMMGLILTALWINGLRVDAVKALEALQEANQRRLERLIVRFPVLINELEFDDAEDLVLEALNISVSPKLSLSAASELMYFYCEAEKTSKAWTIYQAAQSLYEDSDQEGTDSLQILKNYLSRVNTPESLQKIQIKYYPKMTAVTGGTFWMGDDARDSLLVTKEGLDDLRQIDLREVSIADFYIGETEVTVLQYRLYCEATNRDMPKTTPWGLLGDNPIMRMNWMNAIGYANWLSDKNGLNPVYTILGDRAKDVRVDHGANGYRLPTEAEWEFAAGGGNLGRTDGRKNTIFAGSDDVDLVAWHKFNSVSRTHPVRQKKPNELGLHDMAGNVREWCQDWYEESLQGPVKDPKGPETGLEKILRGGVWRSPLSHCRISRRGYDPPTYNGSGIGFRLAQSVRGGE